MPPGDGRRLAFLASGIEGIKVRITARAAHGRGRHGAARRGGGRVRRAIEARLGDIVFGVDDESMEVAVAGRLVAPGPDPRRGRVAHRRAHRLAAGQRARAHRRGSGAGSWPTTRRSSSTCSGVPVGPVVTEAAAAAMAEGAARVTGADVGLGITGVAGPDDQEGVAPGTVFVGLRLPGRPAQTRELRVPGDRERVRQYAAISALDLLRRALDALRLIPPERPRSQEAHSRVTLEGQNAGAILWAREVWQVKIGQRTAGAGG